MGISKTHLFTPRQNELADLARVLAHPARIAILDYLLKQKACVNHELVGELGLAQATVSQHLRELKDAGLIQGTIEGSRLCYCIHPERWAFFQQALSDWFSGLSKPGSDSSCC